MKNDNSQNVVLKGVASDNNFSLIKMFNWRNDPAIYHWCRQETLLSFEEHKEYWKRIQSSSNNKMFEIYRVIPRSALYESDEQELIGVCGLTNINWTARHGEFSLYIAPEFQKKGYARKALTELLRIGFDDLGFNKIWGESFDGNPAIKLFKEMGFDESPGHKEHYLKRGLFVDTKFYTIYEHNYWIKTHETDCRDFGQP